MGENPRETSKRACCRSKGENLVLSVTFATHTGQKDLPHQPTKWMPRYSEYYMEWVGHLTVMYPVGLMSLSTPVRARHYWNLQAVHLLHSTNVTNDIFKNTIFIK